MRNLVVLCVVGLFLAGCGSNPFGSLGSLGSLNPFGGRSTDSAARDGDEAAPLRPADGSVLVERLDTAVAEEALRGVIIRVTGRAPSQGYATPRLVAVSGSEPDENGIVTYEFRADPPEDLPTATGAQRLLAAAFVPDSALGAIRGFRIIARTNSIGLRR